MGSKTRALRRIESEIGATRLVDLHADIIILVLGNFEHGSNRAKKTIEQVFRSILQTALSKRLIDKTPMPGIEGVKLASNIKKEDETLYGPQYCRDFETFRKYLIRCDEVDHKNPQRRLKVGNVLRMNNLNIV